MDIFEKYTESKYYTLKDFKNKELSDLEPGDNIIIKRVPREYSGMLSPGVHKVLDIYPFDDDFPLSEHNSLIKVLLNESDPAWPTIKNCNLSYKDIKLGP